MTSLITELVHANSLRSFIFSSISQEYKTYFTFFSPPPLKSVRTDMKRCRPCLPILNRCFYFFLQSIRKHQPHSSAWGSYACENDEKITSMLALIRFREIIYKSIYAQFIDHATIGKKRNVHGYIML